MDISNYTWWVFGGLAFGALIIDYFAHGKDHQIKLKEAVLWSLFYIGVAGVFVAWLYFHESAAAAQLFTTGFVLEKMLSVDNLFVFSALFVTFQIADAHKHKILLWGIIGAIVFRGIFVVLGTAFIHLFGGPVLVIFGIIILYTAWAMFKAGDGEEEDLNEKWFVKYPSKWLPITGDSTASTFFQNGKATSLFLCMIAMQLADVAFSFDSVPAVIAVSNEPIIIYSSMMFAILGLRALYFVLDALKGYLRYLETAVIAILVFIGIKLIGQAVGFHVDPTLSLGIVVGLLAISVVASLVWSEKEDAA